jgi:mRNA-degrading endonuclease RelE of RelBE toxin-antitoxin system
MTYKLRFHPQFVTGLENSISFYCDRSKKTGARFKAGVRKQLNLIKSNPFIKSVRYDNVRFARIEGFPYAIHYTINEVNRLVLVHRILCDYQYLE